MPHSTLLSSIASDMSVSFIKAVRSHMVTYNKTASKAAGTAPCQNHLLQSSPITIPSAFSGAAQCPRRGRAREGGGCARTRSSPHDPAELRHPRPADPPGPAAIIPERPGPAPCVPAASHWPAPGAPQELIGQTGAMGGALHHPAVPHARSRFHGGGNAAGSALPVTAGDTGRPAAA